LSIADNVAGDIPRLRASSVGVTPGGMPITLVTANSDTEASLPSPPERDPFGSRTSPGRRARETSRSFQIDPAPNAVTAHGTA
jgi:hypothetical protein